MDQTIEKAAHELAELHRASGRLEETAEAASAGLRRPPTSLRLHEDRLRACAADRPRFEQARRESDAALPKDPHLAAVRADLLGEPAR